MARATVTAVGTTRDRSGHRRVVRRVVASGRAAPDPDAWPGSVPAVAQLLRDGLELPAGVTFLVGENGTGKSTLVEAIAMAFGLAAEGGTPYLRTGTRPTESPLHEWITLERAPGAPRWGFFLRAETMHGYFTRQEDYSGDRDPEFHEMSHGESFLEVLRTRFDSPGLYCLDEPEAALSFSAQMALVATLHDLAAGGAQVICATHSPLLAALPGALILETGPGASAGPCGRTWSSSATGAATSMRRCGTCGTSSNRTETQHGSVVMCEGSSVSDKKSPVLVTGGTGRVGRMVVEELLEVGVPVRALVREPTAAGLPDQVDVVAGDLEDPASLEPALREISTVFLVWTLPFDSAPAVVDELGRRDRRVVLLSAPHRTHHPFFQQPNPMATLLADLEALIERSGLSSTMIRPGMLASNALAWWAPAIRSGAPVRWPYAAAETAPIDDRDVAAVAARALCDDSHAGGDYVLTGPAPLTQEEQVRTIGEVIGNPVVFEELSPDGFRQETAGTWPPSVVDMLLGAWQATMGHPAYVTSTVHDVLGRPARSFRDWAADHAAAFRA